MKDLKSILSRIEIKYLLSYSVISLIFIPYYYVRLYQLEDSFTIIFTERLFFYFFHWLGIFVMSLLVNRLGTNLSFKISNILVILSLLFIIINLDNLSAIYILAAMFLGFSRGMFWPVYQNVILQEQNKKRTKLIYIRFAVLQILGIILPIAGGLIIGFSSSGLIILASISIFIQLLPVIFFNSKDKKSHNRFRISEVVQLIKNKWTKYFLVAIALETGATFFLAIIILIIPFVLTNSELSVGIIIAIASFSSALISFVERNLNIKKRTKFAIIGFSISYAFSVIFVLIWSYLALVVMSIVQSITKSVSATSQSDYRYRLKRKLIGIENQESAIEMNLLDETATMVGRIIAFTIGIVIFSTNLANEEALLRGSIIILSIVPLISYLFIKHIDKSYKTAQL